MILVLYSDKECFSPLDDLGELEVTEQREIVAYLKNTGITKITRIDVTTNDPSVKITSHPEELGRDEVGEVFIQWSVPHDTMEGRGNVKFFFKGISIGVQ